MPASDPHLERLMTAIADGDRAMIWAFHEMYEVKLRAIVTGHLRSMGRHDVVAESARVDGLVIDALMVLVDRSGGWEPGGAAPWTWADHAIRSRIAAELGHRSVALPDDDPERVPLVDQSVPVAVGAGVHVDSLTSLADQFPPVGLLRDAFESVGSRRNQEVAWLFRVQKLEGDPSPAHTVAREFDISPDNARQIHGRHWNRVRSLVQADDRYAPLRRLDWFVA